MTSDNNITSIPLENYIDEGISQKDRIIKEVMDLLFKQIKTDSDKFSLADGTFCRVQQFVEPSMDENKQLRYAFDVIMDFAPLSHLEFTVQCTGWGRSL